MSRWTSVVRQGHVSQQLLLSLLLCACSSNGCVNTGRQGLPGDPPANGTGAASGTNPGSGNTPGASNPGNPIDPTPNPTPGGTGGVTAMPMPMGSGGSTPIKPMPGTMNDPSMLPPALVTNDIPSDVFAILQARCSACHTYGQGDLAGWGSALDLSRMVDAEIVVPGNPNASRMIDRVVVRGDMPPRGDRVPATEIDKLRAWITSLKRPILEPRTDEDILDEISADVLKLRSLSSDFRYISLAHFIDMGRPEKEVKVAKNVLAFLVNSLSRRGNIVSMIPVDSRESIFRIRLSDLGWSAQLWDQLTSFYPYCLASDLAGHQSLYVQLQTEVPFVRADWFWDTASRAPLYDLLVDIPNNVNDVARRLGINIANDINHPGVAEPDNLVRFAVQRSGVSLHNRMAERHLGAQGQYLWISYDFKTDTGRQDIFANPLGPRAVDQQRFVHTFENDAGEVIFSLPNGMQGYMLVNAQGNKIAIADTAIVRDIRRPTGAVENGVSCFGCHGGVGMIRPRRTDEVRNFINGNVSLFQVREFQEITALYPPLFQPDVLAGDSSRYRGLLDGLDGGGPPRGVSEYSELVALVGEYESNLGFRGAAAEFNEDLDAFKQRVQSNDPLNRAFPRSPADPLLSRVDAVCAWRDLAPKIAAKRFCNKSFNAAAVQGLCR